MEADDLIGQLAVFADEWTNETDSLFTPAFMLGEGNFSLVVFDVVCDTMVASVLNAGLRLSRDISLLLFFLVLLYGIL